MEGGQEAFPIKAMPRAPVKSKPKPSPCLWSVLKRPLPEASDLLWLTAQVVVVSHGDDTEQHPTEQQQQGGVGQDADLH